MAQRAKRVKLRRKDIRQPDEFETLTAQAVVWVREHQGVVAGAVAVLAAVALVALLVSRSRAARAETAALDFRGAYTTFQAGKYAEAADAFAALGNSSPGTPFGRLAGLYHAHALARQGDAPGAAAAYVEYLAGSPEPVYLRQEALMGVAQARERTSDVPGALDAYNQAAALEGPFVTGALLGVARLQEASGHLDQAREAYLRVKALASDPDLQAFVAAKLPAEMTAPATAPGEAPIADVR